MKRPSLAALFFGVVPFIAVCFWVSLWDRIHPIILGVPFNLFWLIMWMFLTSLCLWAAYRMEVRSENISAGKKETE